MLSLGLAIASFCYTRHKTHVEGIRQRVFGLIDELTSRTEETADEMQRHLSKENECKRKADLFRLHRKCESLCKRLIMFVPKAEKQLTGAYHDWYVIVFGEGFPVERKADRVNPDSARYRDVATAQAEFGKVLVVVSKAICG